MPIYSREGTERWSRHFFFLWGSRASYLPYHQKDIIHSTRYHGEEPLQALLMLYVLSLFFCLENKARTFFYTWKALSTFTLATLLFIVFSVQSSKGDVLSDQFVLLFDFLLSSNLVSHYYFAFLTERQLLLASLLTSPSPLMSFFTITWMEKNRYYSFQKRRCPNLEIRAPIRHFNRSPATFPLQRHTATL